MKKTLLTLLLLGLPILTQAQVMVNDIDINKTINTFKLQIAEKPITVDEYLFIDYGQKDPNHTDYYLRRNQVIKDKDGNQFKTEDYNKLLIYLGYEGWSLKRRETNVEGNKITKVLIFERSNEL